jgi:hypothetical protein
MNSTSTSTILDHIRSLGYLVKEFRVNDTGEFHATPLRGDAESQAARCNDGDGSDEEYRTACLLAQLGRNKFRRVRIDPWCVGAMT